MSRDAAPPLVPLRPEDAPALAALMDAIDAHEVFEHPLGQQGAGELLAFAGLDPARDTLAAWEGDRLLGAVILETRSSPDTEGRARCGLIGGVHPVARGRGLGTALLEEGERIATRAAAERLPGAPAILRMDGGFDPRDAGDPETGAAPPAPGGTDIRPLLDARGYTRVRSFLEMVRPLPGDALEHPAPAGITLRAPGSEDQEPVRLAHNAAFADHWGSAPTDAARWHDLWTSHTARPDLAALAVDRDGTVLAYTYTTTETPGELHVELVGTRPEGRGRGLARAVLARSLAAAAADGFTRAKLEVDAASLTGATRLYDGLGFTRHRVSSLYEKPLG